MEKKILFVGLDVDDKNFHAYVLPESGEPGFAFKCRPDVPKAILRSSARLSTR